MRPVPEHRVDWKLIGDGAARTLVLAIGIDWNDLIVRVDVRDEARRISCALRCVVKIVNAEGDLLDTIPWAPP